MIPLTFTPDPIQPARAQQGQAYMVQKRRATVSGGSGGGGFPNGCFHPWAITEVARKEARNKRTQGPKILREVTSDSRCEGPADHPGSSGLEMSL